MLKFISAEAAEAKAVVYLRQLGLPVSTLRPLLDLPDRVHGHGGRKGRGKSSGRGSGKRSGKKKVGK